MNVQVTASEAGKIVKVKGKKKEQKDRRNRK